MLNLEDTQVIIDIESLINYYKDEIYYLKEELKLKDTEIDETKKLMINKVYFQEEKRPKNLKNDVKNVITN